MLVIYGFFHNRQVLMTLAAFMNTCSWLWITSSAILAIIGAVFTHEALAKSAKQQKLQTKEVEDTVSSLETGESEKLRLAFDSCPIVEIDDDKVMHMVVLPNYREDEDMLAVTLQSLAESADPASLVVVLAMEEREVGSYAKAERLQKRFQQSFANLVITAHPANLKQGHLDGSEDPEAPGKASNLRWAVPDAFAQCQKENLLKTRSSIVLKIDAGTPVVLSM